MTEREALRAPTSPPETGASIDRAPRAVARSAIRRARAGLLVVKSMRSGGHAAAARMPSGPRKTSSTSVGSPTIAQATSAPSAASRGEAAHEAPASRSARARSGVRVWTTSGCPAASRCPAIERPMTPVPIQAMRGSAIPEA